LETAAITAGPDWIWRDDRVRRLLATQDNEVLFVSGCTSNHPNFYRDFDQSSCSACL
jgi:hypothetical protein